MIKNKIIYLVVLIYSAILAILYNEYSMSVVVLVVGSLPIILFGILLCLRSRVSVQLESDLLVVNRGADIGITITVTNGSFLPVGHMKMVIVAKNGFTKQKSKKKISCYVDGKSQQRLHCELSSNHCGSLVVSCKNIRIYDYFRIFSLKKTVQQSVKIAVLPGSYEIENQIKLDQSKVIIDSDVFSKLKSGDDPSEVFAIRDYQQGDRLHRIHWKLSTKKKQLLVKEYSLPIGCSVCILLEFYFKGSEKEQLSYIDALLDTTLSLSYSLIQSDCPHFISWYDKNKDEFKQAKISKEEDIYMVVEELLQIQLYSEIGKVIELQQIFCSQEQLTNIYYIGTDFSLEEGERLRETYQGAILHMLHINDMEIEQEKKTLFNQLEGLLIQATRLELSNLEAGLKTLEI